MSYHARAVLAAIDQAHAVRERHPTLFAQHLRADHTCLQLAKALNRYRRRQPPGREETYMGDREAERVDPSFENLETERRHRHWDARKPDRDRQRREELRRMGWPELADWIRAETARLSTVSAGNPEPARGGADSTAPPQQQRLEDDPRWRRRAETAKRTLLALADLVLEAQGHGTHADVEMSTMEVAREVLHRTEGMSCRDAADECRDLPGVSPAFVNRLRRNQGTGLDGLDLLGYRISPIDGRPQMDTDKPGVRRVTIEAS